MSNEKENGLKNSAKFFMEQKVRVHIVMINSNPPQPYGPNDVPILPRAEKFYNGLILEIREKEGLFILDDIKLGPIPIPINDIYRLEKFRENQEQVPKSSFYQM